MRIFSVNLLQLNKTHHQNDFKNNRYNDLQTGYSVLTNPKDAVSFTAKIPSIIAPTMEDLINRTKAVDILRFNILRLAKYKIPCPCCGHIMLDVDTFKGFEKEIMSAEEPGEILKLIGSLKQYLHPVESRIYSMMISKHHNNPKMTLHNMLREKLPEAEKKIVHEQTNLLSNIGLLSRKLPPNKHEYVKALINETFSRLFDTRETSRFSRKIFINKLEFILLNNSDNPIKNSSNLQNFRLMSINEAPSIVRKIIAEAAKLPTAYNNPDAFIVKYAKRDYRGADPDKKIALRMLSNSLATIEHIQAQKLRGETSPENLALECACDNNRRNHETLTEQILQNPMMIINYLKYMKRLCEIHIMGKVERAYITQQNKTFRNNSFGILDADLGLMRKPKKVRQGKSGITPTKAERRKIRKERLKQKKFKHTKKQAPNLHKRRGI